MDLVVARTRDRYLNWCRVNGLNPKKFLPISRSEDLQGRANCNVWWTEPEICFSEEFMTTLFYRARAAGLTVQNRTAVPLGQDD